MTTSLGALAFPMVTPYVVPAAPAPGAFTSLVVSRLREIRKPTRTMTSTATTTPPIMRLRRRASCRWRSFSAAAARAARSVPRFFLAISGSLTIGNAAEQERVERERGRRQPRDEQGQEQEDGVAGDLPRVRRCRVGVV